MAKIAVDVVLLPPEEVMDVVVDINNKSETVYSRLSKKDNLPHITLAMAVIDEQDIPKIGEFLSKISTRFSPFPLEIPCIYDVKTKFNHTSWGFKVNLTAELKKLHSEIMKEIMHFRIVEKTEQEMFFREKGEKINELSLRWVDNYKKNHTNPDNYFPHISLKCKEPRYDKFPITFVASKMALCLQGNYCTCRKILFSTELSSNILKNHNLFK